MWVVLQSRVPRTFIIWLIMILIIIIVIIRITVIVVVRRKIPLMAFPITERAQLRQCTLQRDPSFESYPCAWFDL